MNFSASDRWGFSHSQDNFSNYFIESDSLEFLLSRYNKTESDWLNSYYNSLMAKQWSGSCHGMTTVAFLFKSNRLTPQYWDLNHDRKDFIDDETVANSLIQLYADESKSLINYYHLMQKTIEQRNVFTATLKNGDNKNIENIVSLVKDNAIVFGFQYEYKYKALLAHCIDF